MKLQPVHITLALALWLAAVAAHATEVGLVGLFGNKALLVIDNGAPRTLAVGQTSPEGVKLIGVEQGRATIEADGARRTLTLGQRAYAGQSSGNPKATLTADRGGHFYVQGTINGRSTRMVVDTGATSVAMSANEARRLGISYEKGQRGAVSTANGVVAAYRVTLDSVKVGGVTLHQVDGTVMEGNGLPIVLLGMSFLSRVKMDQQGSTLVLEKQY